MDIGILLQTVSGRLQYCYENNEKFPEILIESEDGIKELNLFSKKYIGCYEIIYPITSVWSHIVQDSKIKVLEFLGGKRNVYDLSILFDWMNKYVDVDSGFLQLEILST